MPKVEISSGTITIDSVSSIEATNLSNVKVTARFHCDDLPSSTANASIKIDPESLRLLINGKPVYYQVDNVTYYYTVALPNFTTNGSLTKFDDSDTAYVSAVNSKFTLYELYDNVPSLLRTGNLITYFLSSSFSSGNFCPILT